MTADTASSDSPLIQHVLNLEEQAARLLRDAEAEAASVAAAVLKDVEAMRAAAAAERKRKVEALEQEGQSLLERAAADVDARHAADLAAVDENRPERKEAAVDYLLARLKST